MAAKSKNFSDCEMVSTSQLMEERCNGDVGHDDLIMASQQVEVGVQRNEATIHCRHHYLLRIRLLVRRRFLLGGCGLGAGFCYLVLNF